MIFWKYHGIGNDFIVLNGIDEDLEIDNILCKRMCDRHFGIGDDGVLYVLPGKNGSDITMRIINADGSEAEMCGNGIRCVAKLAYDFGKIDGKRFTINTLRGNLTADVTVENDKVRTVTIDMGAPILEAPGKTNMESLETTTINTAAGPVKGFCISMGNPHFVTFDRLTDEKIDALGPILESHRVFPKKTNVEFATVDDEGKIHIRVYERGAAWTLACGTGACATTTAAALNGMVPFDEPVDVELPGGWLRVTVDKDLRYVRMEGPATFVYAGDYEE